MSNSEQCQSVEGMINLHVGPSSVDNSKYYLESKRCLENLELYLKPLLPQVEDGNVGNSTQPILSRYMQRKLTSLINCHLDEKEGLVKVLHVARSIGQRTTYELMLLHQNPQQLSANLWTAIRARGCQFLGPAMQEEVLKLILLALEDGSALCRRVLVMFVVQRLEPHFPHASKTSIGHVVQLLYRASCFKVSKREGDSSLMQLKEKFRTYQSLRREHDAQIVQIATEVGVIIAPDQWSALLYGDANHMSHMQSIMNQLKTSQSFAQSLCELLNIVRSEDGNFFLNIQNHFEKLASISLNTNKPLPSWQEICDIIVAVCAIVQLLLSFPNKYGCKKAQFGVQRPLRYHFDMCPDLILREYCSRGSKCAYSHSTTEMNKLV